MRALCPPAPCIRGPRPTRGLGTCWEDPSEDPSLDRSRNRSPHLGLQLGSESCRYERAPTTGVLTKATTQTITDARSQPRTRPGEPPSTSDASSRYHHPVRRTLSASVLCAPDQRSPGTRVRTASTLAKTSDVPQTKPPVAMAGTPNVGAPATAMRNPTHRSEEHTSELQSLMRNSYAVFCLKKKKKTNIPHK